jgi:hypothetical protein
MGIIGYMKHYLRAADSSSGIVCPPLEIAGFDESGRLNGK